MSSMNTYRFVGSEAHIGSIKLERFGKRFSVDEKLALSAMKGGAAIIPEEEFNKHFPPGEDTNRQLKIWADPFMPLLEIPTDPAEAADKEDFMRKREAAQQAYRDIRQGLLEPKPEVVEIEDKE